MISHLLCYLKHTLFKARKPWIFKIFSLRPTLNVMPWISETSEIKSITESFWGNRTDLIIYTHFGSSQPPVYLEISTAFLTRETSAIIPKKLLKKELTYSSNTSYGSFYAHFCCRKGISCYHSNERIIAEPFRWLLFTIKQPAMLNCRRKSIWDSFLIIFLSNNLLVKESEFLPWHFLRTFCICVKCIMLYNCLCSSSSFCASVIWNIREFGAKNYFTDHQTYNTIHGFRDSVLVLKLYNCN